MFRATALTWVKTFIIFLSFLFIRSDTSVSVCVCVSSVDEKHNSKWWRPQSFVDMKNEYSQTSARFKWKKSFFCSIAVVAECANELLSSTHAIEFTKQKLKKSRQSSLTCGRLNVVVRFDSSAKLIESHIHLVVISFLSPFAYSSCDCVRWFSIFPF